MQMSQSSPWHGCMISRYANFFGFGSTKKLSSPRTTMGMLIIAVLIYLENSTIVLLTIQADFPTIQARTGFFVDFPAILLLIK